MWAAEYLLKHILKSINITFWAFLHQKCSSVHQFWENSVSENQSIPFSIFATGSSKASYALHFADNIRQLDYRCVVFNNRGFGGAQLRVTIKFTFFCIIRVLSRVYITLAHIFHCQTQNEVKCARSRLRTLLHIGISENMSGHDNILPFKNYLFTNLLVQETIPV